MVFIGDVIEDMGVVNVNMMFPDKLIGIGDTLFFITKNDSLYVAQDSIYLRRHKFKN
jgi:hypothetical protein